MQCELCNEPGTVAITEVEHGKVIDLRLCGHHAAKRMGCPTPEQFDVFHRKVTAHFKERGVLPSIEELSQLGEAGEYTAKLARRRHTDVFGFLQSVVDKRMAVTPNSPEATQDDPSISH